MDLDELKNIDIAIAMSIFFKEEQTSFANLKEDGILNSKIAELPDSISWTNYLANNYDFTDTQFTPGGIFFGKK